MVDSLISIAREKLNTIIQDEVTMLVCVKNEIEKLFKTFILIQAVLEDAESRRVKDRAVKIWLEKLKEVAYDVDDILNEWTTENLRSQAAEEGDGSCFSFIVICFLSPLTCFNHVIFRHRIGCKIKEARGRFDDIAKEITQLGLTSVTSGERERVDTVVRQHEIRKRETSSQFDRSWIVGREEDKKEVLNLLLTGSSQEVTQVPVVISIVGMGGLGKTTLARLAYNDEEVNRHFDVNMWVCVSENFDVKQITKLIIESATGSTPNVEGLETLQSRLRGILHLKRFLLVLDDIWSDDRGMWDVLRLPFQAGAVGSRIIITTRSENVAKAMGNTHMCTLKGLSDDECWLLFSSKAFEHRSKTERSELEETGRKIANKCGGVPLAAKTLGSVMESKTKERWNGVLQSEIWDSDNKMEGILPALLLSYYDLPPALKQCFAYFSIFPKDWGIEKDTIVKLWVSQGFIGSDTSKDMEETGGDYFDDLLKRSLLQDALMDGDGTIFIVTMHDLVHDLAQFVAGNDCSIKKITQGATFNLNKVRHSSLTFSDSDTFELSSNPPTFCKAHKLRTLLVFPESSSTGYSSEMSEMEKERRCRVLHNLFHHLRCLRALEMSGAKISRLPRTVGQLKQLRYLDLSRSLIEELPEELIDCINLQSLILTFCRFLKRLPREMRKLISLRHLELFGTDKLEYLPKGIGRLTSLQTLTDFIVGGIDGCELGELKHINLLRGSLHISQLQKVMSSQDDAMQPDLCKKTELRYLSLSYSYGEVVGDEEKRREEVVLQGLQPHTNLKVLLIEGYSGSKFPDWMGDPSFSNLSTVTLVDCTDCEELPPLWNLPMLRLLSIRGCPLLAERYKKGGDDWHKIAHIFDVSIYE